MYGRDRSVGGRGEFDPGKKQRFGMEDLSAFIYPYGLNSDGDIT